MLASSSQDCFIRIYKIESTEKDIFEINEKFFILNKDGKIKSLKLQSWIINSFHLGNQMKYIVTLETVLVGHENWVNKMLD